jgi:hypothetical protein
MKRPKTSGRWRSEIRWAIVGRHGLYTGQSLTRRGAIQNHVRYFWPGFPKTPPDDITRKLWATCRKRGDRAVKVAVTWEE